MSLESEITIRVKTLDGQSRDVQILPSSTILELKEIIAVRITMPSRRQRIIYQGRVLTDEMIISEQGDLNGSAVHVVEHAPPTTPATTESATRNSAVGSESSRARSRFTDTLGRLNRVRTNRTEQSRDAQVRSRVARMESWLNQLNASITALERRTAPEESRQYIPDNEQERRNNSESGAMPVTELAGFVQRLADGIERFPPRLRELQQFLEEDRLLRSRDSDEYAQARSLIQNAMDATRFLSQITQYFSQLIIPLGEVPPRNLNIINTSAQHIRMAVPNMLPFLSGQVSEQTRSIMSEPPGGSSPFGPLLVGPIHVDGTGNAGSATGSQSASSMLSSIGSAAEALAFAQAQSLGSSTPEPSSIFRPANNAGVGVMLAEQSAPQSQRSQTTFHILNPNRQTNNNSTSNSSTPSSAPRVDGINATINVSANITPNITIVIEQPNSTGTSRPTATAPTTSIGGTTAASVADQMPGLPAEILQEIANSVNRLTEHNDPVVIHSTSQPNRDVGRIVGEAVTATLMQLAHQSNQQTEIRTAQSTSTNTARPTTTTSTSTSTGSTSSRPNPPKLKRKREEVIFTESQLSEPIANYLFGESSRSACRSNALFETLEKCGLKQVSLQHVVSIFKGKGATKEMKLALRNLLKSDSLPSAFRRFVQQLFSDQRPNPEVDIIESNLSLMRHFLRELETNLESNDLEQFGNFFVQFSNLWIALNCDILRGGEATLEKCIRSKLVLRPHPDKYIINYIQWAKKHSTSVDGYVMSEKIHELENSSNEGAPEIEENTLPATTLSPTLDYGQINEISNDDSISNGHAAANKKRKTS